LSDHLLSQPINEIGLMTANAAGCSGS